MSEVHQHDPEAEPPMALTPEAAEKVREILAAEGDPDLQLRVLIQGGGCSGFQYAFALEDSVAEDDVEIVSRGVRLIVDMISLAYLEGATVDYRESIEGAQFTIANPNAATTCGCGSSFSV